ncbi:sec-independent protein translocase protein TatB [Peteryoungia aggregata LMG 23059]|uniref:Sec-independent protein translocase protein TatB n=1 Tax=Peteryoungia aggregata LMG 23059 TaxID=1368425 RepID=A0ABU0G6S3_9HYPH|nr:Sec-independent protein translocase protein TatB [Peteryoungia aggregata]MDQ0421017.1 sec-independent protein translocase protein TatB [Peteryoungia aggregata LMG 23059]
MLDIGWTELLVIAVILIVVVGPKDLPPMIRAFGKMTKRLRQTAGEFRAQFDEALREAELDDLKNSVNDLRSLNPANTIRETLNPLRQMGQEIKSDLERSTRPDSKSASTDEDFEQNSILPDLPFGLDEPPQELKPVAQTPAQPAPAPQAVPAPAPAVAVPASASAVPEATTSAPATSSPAAPAPAKARKTATQKPSAKTEAPAKNPIKPAKAAPVAKTVAAPTAAPKTAAATAKAKPSKPAAAKAPSAQTPSTATKAPAKPRKTKSEDRA